MFIKKSSMDNNKVYNNRLVIILLVLFFLIAILIFLLFSSHRLSSLRGDSVTSYYCKDSTYTLKGDKCVKQVEESPILLGDINKDNNINDDDLKLLSNQNLLSSIQKKAGDIDESGVLEDSDIKLLEEYIKDVSNITNSNNIGVKKICDDNYTLSNDKCIKEEVLNAFKSDTGVGSSQSNSAEINVNNENSNPVEIDITSDYPTDYYSGQKRSLKKVNIYADIKINNNKTYYYKWITYRYNTIAYQSECLELTSGKKHTSLDLTIGKRQGIYEIYDDNKCINKINEFKTEIYYNHHYNMEERVEIETVKAETTNVLNGKVTVDNNVKNKDLFPSNTKIYMKFKFNIYKKKPNSELYYTWHIEKPSAEYGHVDSGCWPVPDSGIVYKDFILKTKQKVYDSGNGYFEDYFFENNNHSHDNYDYDSINSNVVSVKTYDNSLCISKNDYVAHKRYNIKNFNIKYDANGGIILENNGYKKTETTENYGYNNIDYLWNNIDNSYNRFIYKKGYDLIGFRVKNSKGKYICYTNNSQTEKKFTDESYCKKYGYVIYKKNIKIARTTDVNGETLTFIAQWHNNPVSINISKPSQKNVAKGTKVTNKITFKLNDKINDYYFKWIVYKGDSRHKKGTDYLTESNQCYADNEKKCYNSFFANYTGPVTFDYDEKNLNWDTYVESKCMKIKDSMVYKPQFVIDSFYTNGVVEVYSDSSCRKYLSTEPKVHKVTEVYSCKNC